MDLLLVPRVELLNVIALLAGVATFTWAIMATPLRLYRLASKRFALANGVIFCYFIGYQWLTPFTGEITWLVSHLALFFFALLYQSGVRILFRHRLNKSALWLTLIFAAIAIFLASYTPDSLPFVLALVASLTAAVFYNGTRIKQLELRKEFSRVTSFLLSLPDYVFISVVFFSSAAYIAHSSLEEHTYCALDIGIDVYLWLAVGLVVLINATAMTAAIMRLVLKITFLAEHDQLTGLLNRRAIKKMLQIEWRKFQLQRQLEKMNAKNKEQPEFNFSVLMVDVDHFKHINDEFGHDAGDAALTFVSKNLSQLVREGDYCARFGGEEFIIILTNTTHDTALARASAICQHFAQTPWREGVPPLTLSIGCETAMNAKSIDQLLSRADHALYQAKRSGRNRTIAYSASFA
jgi:diguanylate cyclase (GGDEF)-like protein